MCNWRFKEAYYICCRHKNWFILLRKPCLTLFALSFMLSMTSQTLLTSTNFLFKYRVHRISENTEFCVPQTHRCQMWAFQTISLTFVLIKKWFCQILPIFNACICIFGGGYATQLSGMFSRKKGGIQVLAGLAPSSQIVGSLMRALQSQVEKFGKTRAEVSTLDAAECMLCAYRAA